MRIEKKITVFIKEEPVDPQVGDLWIEGKDSQRGKHYSIRKKNSKWWGYESEYLTAENLRDLYGVDIEAIERSHLIRG